MDMDGRCGREIAEVYVIFLLVMGARLSRSTRSMDTVRTFSRGAPNHAAMDDDTYVT